jgi:gas vesicle protein
MFCSKEDHGSAILISLIVGGMVGAAVALLLAPQSGRKTREDIADLAGDITDSVGGYARKVREKLT